jgi:glycosyltransferase involved in cell wall biosynthesis
MRVSVLLPVFNAEPTLPQAIESILGQEYSDFDLLLIDDGSRDRSPDIIRSYARQDSRVKARLNPENAGLCHRLNEGLALARGDLVARIDSDDEALPERLRVQVDFMDRNPDVVVAGSWVFHMGAVPEWDRLVRLPCTSKQIAQILPRENCIYHPAVIMRRAEVLHLGGYRVQFAPAEDYELWLRVSGRHKLANIARPLLRYRLSHGGMTFSRRWEFLYSTYLAQEAHLNPDKPVEERVRATQARLASTDRQRFFAEVARHAVEDLIRLQQWQDARTLIEKHCEEIPPALVDELRAQVTQEETVLICAPGEPGC